MLLAATVLLKLLDVLVKLFQVLALDVKLFFEPFQAVHTISIAELSNRRLSSYLSISFSRMNLVSAAASRLVQLSLYRRGGQTGDTGP